MPTPIRPAAGTACHGRRAGSGPRCTSHVQSTRISIVIRIFWIRLREADRLHGFLRRSYVKFTKDTP